MASPVVYRDCSEILEGRLSDVRVAMDDLAAFVKANEPRILAYNVYISTDGKTVTVMHMHPDSDSLAFHMEVAGPLFAKFGDYLHLLTIDVYGEVTPEIIEQLREKAEMLGKGTVSEYRHHAGFIRLSSGNAPITP